MIGFDIHDIVVLGHRPIRAEYAVLGIVDRVFAAQAVEIGPMSVRAEQFRVAGIEIPKRQREGALARGIMTAVLTEIEYAVHGRLPVGSIRLCPENLFGPNYIWLCVSGQECEYP